MATLAMVAKITFPATANRNELVIRKVAGVTVESSWKLLTDRATIVLPRNVRDFDRQKVGELFKRGDKVEIELGYDGNLVSEFTGYIAKSVSAAVPIVIECEDEMWAVKQVPVNVSLKETTLQHLLNTILPQYEVDALEVDLGNVRFVRVTAAQVLQKLQQDFGLYSYFKGSILVCGKVYADDDGVVDYHLERNVLSNQLKYKSAEDIQLEVRAVSTQKDGSKIEVTVGDEGGEQRQLSYYNITSESELEKLALLDLKKYKVSGFDGSLTGYGLPYVAHGFKANIVSDLYGDRDGQYYVESVKTSFNRNGFRRVVQIGEQV